MMRISRRQVFGCIVGFCLSVMFLASCESRDKYVGVYKAEARGSGRNEAIILDLRSNGNGVWKVASDQAKDASAEVPFTWYIKRGDLRINTKAGGVIVGKIEKDAIQMTLPGSRSLTFKKSQ